MKKKKHGIKWSARTPIVKMNTGTRLMRDRRERRLKQRLSRFLLD